MFVLRGSLKTIGRKKTRDALLPRLPYRKQLHVVRFINFHNYPRDFKGCRRCAHATAPPLRCGPSNKGQRANYILIIVYNHDFKICSLIFNDDIFMKIVSNSPSYEMIFVFKTSYLFLYLLLKCVYKFYSIFVYESSLVHI